MQHCLIVARSARALAESARKAGYQVHAIDAFADRDTQAVCDSVRRCDYGASGFDRAQLEAHIKQQVARCPIELIVAGSGIERQPTLFETYHSHIKTCVNTSHTIRSLIDPEQFSSLLDASGIRHPAVFIRKPAEGGRFLTKRVGGMGGEQVAWSATARSDDRDVYYQAFVEGDVYSVVFLADAEKSVIVGFNRQWQYHDDERRPFLYGGAYSIEPAQQHRHTVNQYVQAIVVASGLRGLCGMDYIVDSDGEVHVLEVNPRPPATFELHEGRLPLFTAHVRSFEQAVSAYERCDPYRACGIIYAAKNIRINRNIDWPDWTKDRPCEDSIIYSRQPVCSVHAEADTDAELKKLIKQRQHALLDMLALLPATAD